ncbi:hypothetical protein UPYG_G00178890 [Umbra pygmaea]|uniref:Uncharacterized protein n=1 Tax=Umbra pygmaea TaxID=75934 RepID=A0ABD0WQ71_UMBPY
MMVYPMEVRRKSGELVAQINLKSCGRQWLSGSRWIISGEWSNDQAGGACYSCKQWSLQIILQLEYNWLPCVLEFD